jgi:hypothetical protein
MRRAAKSFMNCRKQKKREPYDGLYVDEPLSRSRHGERHVQVGARGTKVYAISEHKLSTFLNRRNTQVGGRSYIPEAQLYKCPNGLPSWLLTKIRPAYLKGLKQTFSEIVNGLTF